MSSLFQETVPVSVSVSCFLFLFPNKLILVSVSCFFLLVYFGPLGTEAKGGPTSILIVLFPYFDPILTLNYPKKMCLSMVRMTVSFVFLFLFVSCFLFLVSVSNSF